MLHYLRGIVGNLRSLISYGVITGVDDSGGAQTATVLTASGALHAGVEVMQPFGIASSPPADGATTVVLAVGGDPANLVALPLSNPSTRFGGLGAGESVLYAGDGTRVHVKPRGIVEVWGVNVTVNATSVTLNTTTLTVNAPGGTTINGDVQVNGDLTASGDVADGKGAVSRLRGHYDAHTHTDDGGSPPTPQD